MTEENEEIIIDDGLVEEPLVDTEEEKPSTGVEEQHDPSTGYYYKTTQIKADALPIDNVIKFAWYDDDYEEVELWHEYTEEELERQEEQKRMELEKEQMKNLTILTVNSIAATLDDAQVMSISTLFPDWKVGGEYKVGNIVRYNGELYRSLFDSTGAPEHTPDIAVALWKKIGEPGDDGILPWVQPLGYSDAYNKGDKVKHKDKIWISMVDQNVWEPNESSPTLWQEVTA